MSCLQKAICCFSPEVDVDSEEESVGQLSVVYKATTRSNGKFSRVSDFTDREYDFPSPATLPGTPLPSSFSRRPRRQSCPSSPQRFDRQGLVANGGAGRNVVGNGSIGSRETVSDEPNVAVNYLHHQAEGSRKFVKPIDGAESILSEDSTNQEMEEEKQQQEKLILSPGSEGSEVAGGGSLKETKMNKADRDSTGNRTWSPDVLETFLQSTLVQGDGLVLGKRRGKKSQERIVWYEPETMLFNWNTRKVLRNHSGIRAEDIKDVAVRGRAVTIEHMQKGKMRTKATTFETLKERDAQILRGILLLIKSKALQGKPSI